MQVSINRVYDIQLCCASNIIVNLVHTLSHPNTDSRKDKKENTATNDQLKQLSITKQVGTKKKYIKTTHLGTHRLYPQVDSTVDSTTSPSETNHREHWRNEQHKPYNTKDT